MRAGRSSSLIAAAAAFFTVLCTVPAFAANTEQVNRLGFFYDNSFRHIDEFMHPSAMLVTGRCNRYDARFAQARAAGGEVLAYLSFVEMTDNTVCQLDTDFYTVNGHRPDLWPFPTPGVRVDYSGSHMLDVRAGSDWSNAVVAYIENLMREDKVDGVFLDVHGARLWSNNADWSNNFTTAQEDANGYARSPDWTQDERDAWTQGNVDLVRRLDASRRAINPRFIIVNNNTWDRGGFDPMGIAGEQYVDGVTLEHHDISPYQTNYAQRDFGSGSHRRMLIIANSDDDAKAWATQQGVTNVSAQTSADGYGSPAARPLVIGLDPRTDRQKLFGHVISGTTPSAGLTADRKRASRFTLTERGRLRELSANLDGAGGASGTQSLKLVLYRDNGGVPGAKVAESNQRTLSAGAGKAWYSFSLTPDNQVLLTPGDYWIALFTGGTDQVLRDYGDGTDVNWFGNTDTYADGSTDPFGTGNTGAITLAVRAGYTLE